MFFLKYPELNVVKQNSNIYFLKCLKILKYTNLTGLFFNT